MDIKKLKVILDSVMLGSFNKAAEKHLYTPSALIYMADSLENELGIKIIERDSFGIKLTHYGEMLLPKLKELCSLEDEIKKEATDLSQRKSTVTIGCYSSIGKALLPTALIKLRAKFPDTEFAVTVKDSIREMAERGADIFIVNKRECVGRDYIPLYEDSFAAVVTQDRYCGRDELTLEDFNEYPFIMPCDSEIKKEFSDLKTEIINVNADDDSAIIEMVKNGIGNTVLTRLAIGNQTNGVKVLSLKPQIKNEIVITCGRSTPKIKRIAKIIADK